MSNIMLVINKIDTFYNTDTAVETLGPDPVLSISHSHIKTKIREWSHLRFHHQWLNFLLAKSTKAILKLKHLDPPLT